MLVEMIFRDWRQSRKEINKQNDSISKIQCALIVFLCLAAGVSIFLSLTQIPGTFYINVGALIACTLCFIFFKLIRIRRSRNATNENYEKYVEFLGNIQRELAENYSIKSSSQMTLLLDEVHNHVVEFSTKRSTFVQRAFNIFITIILVSILSFVLGDFAKDFGYPTAVIIGAFLATICLEIFALSGAIWDIKHMMKNPTLASMKLLESDLETILILENTPHVRR